MCCTCLAWLQFRTLATDKGGLYARNSSNQATVGVTVKRNKREPRFDGAPYSVQIPQSQAGGSVIATVRAKDEDDRVRVSRHALAQLDVMLHVE